MDIAPEVDLNEITGSVSSPKKTMPYNELLTNLACSSRTGEYWPSVVFVRPQPRANKNSPVRPSLSVTKRLIIWGLFLEGPEKFSHPESRSKILNLRITELFYLHILNINRGSLLTRSFMAYTLARFQIQMN